MKKFVASLLIIANCFFVSLNSGNINTIAAAQDDWQWPVKNQIFARGFYGTHYAIDISASTGTAVNAAKSGVVKCASTASASSGSKCSSCGYIGAGYHVIIDHGNGYRSLYAHLNRVNVTVGQSVSGGQKIGEVGSTGNSTGPHLHFAVESGGFNNFTNPLKLITPFQSVTATSITNNNATIKGVFGAFGPTIEKAGFYIGTSTSNMTKITETVNTNGYDQSGAPIQYIFYTMSKWYPNLKPGTKYYYKMYIVRDGGIEYCSDIYSFTTTGSHTHTWNTGTVTEKPTCTKTGTKTYECLICGTTKTETVSMIPHDYVTTIVPPTENSQGYTLHTCSVCGDNYKDHYTDYVGEDVPQIIIENKTAAAGETVTVNLSVKNNPGFNAASIKIDYDTTRLRLIGAELSEEFSNGTNVSYDNLPYLTFVRGSNIDSDTNMLTLTFEVLGAAVDGDAYITLLYEAGNISNIDEEDVNFKIIDGKITVIDYLPGDINGDGNVNTKDLTRLLKYINHEDVDCTEQALDVNGDGKVNTKDLTRLLKYINHEDVEIF